jgi:hypothetical protein
MGKTDKQPKTVGEWLDWAEEQGYEWAKEAREETVRLSGEGRLTCRVEGLYEAIPYMFVWCVSEKGHLYWQEIFESISHA